MLPILRILPVGGVILAIVILVLALSPPDGSRSSLTATIAPARGALVDRDRHPEVRQFLILAALKRASELSRLRELADSPVRKQGQAGAAKVAGLPSERIDAEPEEIGPAKETPSVSIPIEIGEPSSAELPVTPQEETPPAIKKPEPEKATAESRRRAAHRAHHKVAVNAGQVRQPTLFDYLFNGQPYQPNYNGQPYQQPAYNPPQPQPYSAPQQQPVYTAPQQQPSYSASQQQSVYSAPQPAKPAKTAQTPAPITYSVPRPSY